MYTVQQSVLKLLQIHMLTERTFASFYLLVLNINISSMFSLHPFFEQKTAGHPVWNVNVPN